MIHFTCDVCKRELEPDDDLRYVVKIEVFPALASGSEDFADERDHLEELQNALQDIDEGAEPLAEDVTLAGPGALATAAIENGIATGRGGRGTIYLWSAGGGGANDNSNFDTTVEQLMNLFSDVLEN